MNFVISYRSEENQSKKELHSSSLVVMLRYARVAPRILIPNLTERNVYLKRSCEVLPVHVRSNFCGVAVCRTKMNESILRILGETDFPFTT
mmetsp:Transcript_6606/g.13082  ORF Transcript_6606/g.13082 Transcript_6606/m.13082 type:complete len:91 (+) Transcript_6606:1302-1574(+)